MKKFISFSFHSQPQVKLYLTAMNHHCSVRPYLNHICSTSRTSSDLSSSSNFLLLDGYLRFELKVDCTTEEYYKRLKVVFNFAYWLINLDRVWWLFEVAKLAYYAKFCFVGSCIPHRVTEKSIALYIRTKNPFVCPLGDIR